jgi:hypothetical protein
MTNKDRRLLNNFTDTPSDLVFWSFRYFLGRMTIATTSFASNLAKAWREAWQKVRDAYNANIPTVR